MSQPTPVQPLQTLRERVGWTQQDLAKRAGVYQSAISRIESGTRPTLVIALRLCRALGTDTETAFGHLVPVHTPARTKPREKARTGTHG